MSAVSGTPAIVMTLANMGLRASAVDAIKPDWSCSGAIICL